MRRLLISVFAGALIVSVFGCSAHPGTDGGTGGGSAGGVATAVFTFTRDEAQAVAKTIGSTGGQLSLTDSAGLTWTLVIPSQTSFPSRLVRLIPLTGFGGGPAAITSGVLFEPDGLYFPKPATLTITGAAVPPLTWAFAHDGTRVAFADATGSAGSTSVRISHFSGVGSGPTIEEICSYSTQQYANVKAEAVALASSSLEAPNPPDWPMECVEMTDRDRRGLDDWVRAFSNPEGELIGRLIGTERARAMACSTEGTVWADVEPLFKRLRTKLDQLAALPTRAEIYTPIAVATVTIEQSMAYANSPSANFDERKAQLANRAIAAREEYLRRLKTDHFFEVSRAITLLDRDATLFFNLGNYEETSERLADALTFEAEVRADVTIDQPTWWDSSTESEVQGQKATIAQEGTVTFRLPDVYNQTIALRLTYTAGTHDWLKLTQGTLHTHCELIGRPTTSNLFSARLEVCDPTKTKIGIGALGTNNTHAEMWHCVETDDSTGASSSTDRWDTAMYEFSQRVFSQYLVGNTPPFTFRPTVIDAETVVQATHPGQSSAPLVGSGHIAFTIRHTPK